MAEIISGSMLISRCKGSALLLDKIEKGDVLVVTGCQLQTKQALHKLSEGKTIAAVARHFTIRR